MRRALAFRMTFLSCLHEENVILSVLDQPGVLDVLSRR